MPLKKRILLLVALAYFASPQFAFSQNGYTPWGIDEYELFGLTKQQLSQQFKGKLFFSNDWSEAKMNEHGTGLGYEGATFKLKFADGRVSGVHGVFKGCTANYERPEFSNKREALQYAITNLSNQSGAAEKQKRAAALLELSKVDHSAATTEASSKH